MKMHEKAEQWQAIEILWTDLLVPREHWLRKIDAAMDFARIYEWGGGKFQHVLGSPSLRQTMRDAEVNAPDGSGRTPCGRRCCTLQRWATHWEKLHLSQGSHIAALQGGFLDRLRAAVHRVAALFTFRRPIQQ